MSMLSTLALSHTTETDVSEDFELPEYQAEVRRVVGVQCSVTRDTTFLEENTIEVSGCVLYTVVYLTGEGGLSSLPFYTTWETRLPLPEGQKVSVDALHLVCEGENAVCRVTGPRKLTLSARVKLHSLALGDTDCTTAAPADTVCRTEEMPVVRLHTCRGTGTVSGETGGGKVITCQGHVQITEVRTAPEGLVVDGEASVRFLVQGDSGAYVPVRSRMPIHETLPCPSVNSGYATAGGICAALTVTQEEDGRIRWEMEYDIEGTLCAETTASVTTDGYCTTHPYATHFREVQAMVRGRCIRGQVTLTGEKVCTHLPEGDNSNLQFLYGWGRGSFEKAELLQDKLVLTGRAVCTVLLTGNGDIVTEEVTLPIRYEWELPVGEAPQLVSRCAFGIWDVGGHMEGDTLHLHAEVGCTGVALVSVPCSYLEQLVPDESTPLPPARPSLTLYTPDPTETVWDVQKRYRTTAVQEVGGRYVIRR